MKLHNYKIKFTAIYLTIFAALCVFTGDARAQQQPIKGYYAGDDGGAYFVRQVGNKIYWFGEDPKGGFANVMAGTINGNKVTANFWDVPKGKTKGAGEITLEIQDGGATIVKVSSSVAFGMKTMKRQVMSSVMENGVPKTTGAPPEMRSRPEGYSGGESNLTGAWMTDDLSTYYIREMPNGDVVWYAENNAWGGQGGYAQPAYAHVFIGKRIKGLITGDWVDVPKGKAANTGVMGVLVKGVQDLTVNNPPQGIVTTQLMRSLPNSLRGYADLHAHPMVNLGFGGKLIHGGTDVGSLLPADADCNANVRAKSIDQALGNDNPTHGGFGLFDNKCGDSLRAAFIDIFQKENDALNTPDKSVGYPSFTNYPKRNDISHQKMWVDWIRRSYDGGQRVMVALATNNATLADIASGPGDGPKDDKASADLQLKEIKAFVGRHSDFMEIAYTPEDMRRIVAANKMAVVIGVEIDNIGNFNKLPNGALTPAVVKAEIDRLYAEGARYIFPVHVLDNPFGGTAAYEDLFNYSDKRESGRWWDLQCAAKDTGITYKFEPFIGSDVHKMWKDLLGGAAAMVKLKLNFNAPPPPTPKDPKHPETCIGNVNARGLQTLGRETAIPQMMKHGMLIDIDHMSLQTADDTLSLAENIPGGYPLVSGHTGLRQYQHTENSRTQDQLERIGKLGGMFGLGSEDATTTNWAAQYSIADEWISGVGKTGMGRVAFGTDLNGLVKGAIGSKNSSIYKAGFIKSKTGDKTWDLTIDGVAHYGMLADFLADLKNNPSYGKQVNAGLLRNAEMFAEMWEKAVQKSKGM